MCKKTYPPNDLNQANCEKLWKRARLNIPKIDQHEFDANADTIGIKIGKKSHYCYKEDNWKTHGWCDVNNNKGWGICSYSCKVNAGELHHVSICFNPFNTELKFRQNPWFQCTYNITIADPC